MTRIISRLSALFIVLTAAPALAATPTRAQVDARVHAFSGYYCGGDFGTAYAPGWPHQQQAFISMSRVLGLNMEGAAKKAAAKSSRPLKLRWTQDPDTYIQTISYAAYRGKPASSNAIVVQFQGGNTYVSHCTLKLN